MMRIFSGIRSKMLLITGSGTLLLLTAALYGFWGSDQNQQRYQALIRGELATERALLLLRNDFSQLTLSWNQILLHTGDAAEQQKQRQRFEQISSTLKQQSKTLLQQHTGDRIGKTLRSFNLSLEKFETANRASDFSLATNNRIEDEIITPTMTLLDDAISQINQQASALSSHTINHARDTIKTGLIAMALAVIFAFIQFNISLNRFILKPSQLLAQNLKRMATHDFSMSLSRHSNDELGEIAESAATIRESMLDLINELHEASVQLDASVNQLSEVIEITRNGVEQQLRQTEQVAAAINEMTSSMEEVAEHAGAAAISATSADNAAQDGRRVVTHTIKDIESLAQEMESASGAISELKSESEKIGGLLDVIKGISAQTNLLALNAAIEAARAGEQGRGFAVVADEVRALATRTQQSTEEIEEMIDRLQAGAAGAVEVMENSRRHTRSSTEQSANAGTSLERITLAVTQITQMNAQIAEAAEQQLHVAEEINRSIMNISDITEHSSEGGKRIYEANTNLISISERLNKLVATFRIN